MGYYKISVNRPIRSCKFAKTGHYQPGFGRIRKNYKIPVSLYPNRLSKKSKTKNSSES